MRTGLNLVLCPHSCWNQQALSLQGLMVVDNARRYRYGQAHARKGTRLAVDRDRGRLHRRGACRWHSRGLHPHPPRRAPVQGKKSRPEMGRAAPTANSVTRLSGSADGTRGSVGTKDPRNPQSHFAMWLWQVRVMNEKVASSLYNIFDLLPGTRKLFAAGWSGTSMRSGASPEVTSVCASSTRRQHPRPRLTTRFTMTVGEEKAQGTWGSVSSPVAPGLMSTCGTSPRATGPLPWRGGCWHLDADGRPPRPVVGRWHRSAVPLWAALLCYLFFRPAVLPLSWCRPHRRCHPARRRDRRGAPLRPRHPRGHGRRHCVGGLYPRPRRCRRRGRPRPLRHGRRRCLDTRGGGRPWR